MAKITLNDVNSGLNQASITNSNQDTIETNFNDKVLYRNNPVGEANQMENLIDMNTNTIINLPDPTTDSEPATKGWASALFGGVGDSSSWGEIVGTLSDQTDLQNELDAKADVANPVFTGALATFDPTVRFANGVLTAQNQFFAGAVSATQPKLQFDSSDYLSYDRATNQFKFVVAASTQFTITSTTVNIPSSSLTIPLGSVVVGAPTDGDKGAGSLNAETLWLDGVEISPGVGSGDVTGPGSATSNGVVLFNSTTGKIIKDSGKLIGTSGSAVPLLDGSNTWSALQTFGTFQCNGIDDTASTGTQITITDAKVTFEDNVVFEETLLTNKGEFYMGGRGATLPVLNFDSTDFIEYNRAANDYSFVIAATEQFNITSSGVSTIGTVNTSEHYLVDSTQVVINRQTGWSATTGTELRTNFGDASLSDTSQALRALIVNLKTHGLIGT